MISAVGIKRILFADIDKVTADITPEIAKTNEEIDRYLDVRRPFEFARYYGKI